MKFKKNEKGFTLLEILAVLTLIGIMAMFIAPNVINGLQKGKSDAAKAQISSLTSVLNMYYLDNSSYPSTEQGLKALVEKPTIPPIPDNWNGPYTDKQKVSSDPWNHDFHYACPGVHNPQKYDIYTLGADNAEGGTGENTDIGNW